MDSVLIVSHTEKGIDFFTEMLNEGAYSEIAVAHTCSQARRLMIDQDYDLCIVNAPLPDEFGDSFSQHVASNSVTQVILIVKNELLDAVSAKVEDWGVFTLSKPLNRSLFWSALKLANAAFNKMTRLHNENDRLLQKIDDLRLIDRAKCILIQYLNMSENQAHKYIEKQAMDLRMTRKDVANSILKTYES
jgi:response regulator NasT